MRNQDIDLARLSEEGEDPRPMRLRYGVTANEASHHEPLDVSINREDVELTVDDDGTWDDVEPKDLGVVRTRCSQMPDDLDEQQVAPAAEHDAMHIVGA